MTSRIRFAPNPDSDDRRFFLHGEELTLIRATIDGTPVTPRDVAGGIEVDVPDGPFLWEAEVEIDPQGNTALEGLYMSNGMYCTQCEAEGFRKITYYPDRPDVMAVFTVRVASDLPVLLSNGNPVDQRAGFAEWHDPWPKPAYLFALVAGDLVAHPDSFTTVSGRDVALNLWVRPGDEGKCAFGMEALKKSMIWDEEVYGREYDLDVFNIVAVDDFNMGAMENKGLNIFNSSAVLASPDTSTDMNFERIEAIIAHEYFHNWTGNRITCRDWFQLCLKEGLTVFRDAQFTADMRSEPVKRIGDVIDLRARQFPEDNGPLAHPPRPDRFQEINNFYTATVYEKGAELIAMLKRLVGDQAYAEALIARDPADHTARVIASRAARNVGAYDAAIRHARGAWDASNDEDAQFVAAMIMAQALASDGKRTRAQLWLRRAKHIAPTPEHAARAIRDFRYVRLRNPWQTYLSFNIQPNSNINNGSTDRTSVFDPLTLAIAGAPMGSEVILQGTAVALSGIEYRFEAQTRYRLHETGTRAHDLLFKVDIREFTLSSDAKAEAPDARGSDFAYREVELGYAVKGINRDGQGEARARLQLGQSWYGGDRLASYAELRASQSFVLPDRKRFDLSLTAKRQFGQLVPDADSLTSDLNYRRTVGAGNQLLLNLSLGMADSPNSDFSYDSMGAAVQFALAEPVMSAASTSPGRLSAAWIALALFLSRFGGVAEAK